MVDSAIHLWPTSMPYFVSISGILTYSLRFLSPVRFRTVFRGYFRPRWNQSEERWWIVWRVFKSFQTLYWHHFNHQGRQYDPYIFSVGGGGEEHESKNPYGYSTLISAAWLWKGRHQTEHNFEFFSIQWKFIRLWGSIPNFKPGGKYTSRIFF